MSGPDSADGVHGATGDELYYIACGRRPGWGYVDHPPLVGWVAWLVAQIAGESHLALRVVARAPAAGEEMPIRLGARVRHPKFGEGVVLRYEGNGSNQQVQVNFERAGQKWLMYAYAKLEAV